MSLGNQAKDYGKSLYGTEGNKPTFQTKVELWHVQKQHQNKIK